MLNGRIKDWNREKIGLKNRLEQEQSKRLDLRRKETHRTGRKAGIKKRQVGVEERQAGIERKQA